MEKVRFGRTGLEVSRTSFGAIPIQRLSDDDAVALVRAAHAGGINLFDTARGYTDSEHKLGLALSSCRQDVIITTKTPSLTRDGILRDIDTSLRELGTDYVDVYQFHNPDAVPAADSEAYQTALELKRAGKIRHIGLTNHNLGVAREAVLSGLFDTLQFPLSPLSSDEELEIAALCEQHDVGLLAMKALSGGLITRAITSWVFLRQYRNVVPIYGLQHRWELDEFLGYEKNPPALDQEVWDQINVDRAQLGGQFCRGCGYCLPCPAGIAIPMTARISLFLQRSSTAQFTDERWRGEVEKISDCIDCGHCRTHCPYHLDTPELLRSEQARYREFIATGKLER